MIDGRRSPNLDSHGTCHAECLIDFNFCPDPVDVQPAKAWPARIGLTQKMCTNRFILICSLVPARPRSRSVRTPRKVNLYRSAITRSHANPQLIGKMASRPPQRSARVLAGAITGDSKLIQLHPMSFGRAGSDPCGRRRRLHELEHATSRRVHATRVRRVRANVRETRSCMHRARAHSPRRNLYNTAHT